MATSNRPRNRPAPRVKAPANAASDSSDEFPDPSQGLNFGPLPQLIGYRIRQVYGYLFQTFTKMLRPLNLAPGQYSILLLISLNPGLNQMMLAEATGLDRSTIVPIANRFAKLGWIRRTRRKGDRRAYSLRLTPLGQTIVDQAQPIIAQHEEQLVANLSKEERRALLRLLSRISEGH